MRALTIAAILTACGPAADAPPPAARAAASGAPLLPWTVEIATTGASLAVGDVDGDGVTDVFVGDPAFSSGQPGEGRVAVHRGGPDGPDAAPAVVLQGEEVDRHLGGSIAAADVNGDGYVDLLAASSTDVALHLGGTGGLSPTPAWTTAGAVVAAAGDVNDDGYADFFVDATSYLGGPATPTLSRALPGSAAAGAGDTDGDGYADALVAAAGSAALHLGGPDGLAASAARSVAADGVPVVGAAGDVDGDGLADWAVGEPDADGVEADAGRVTVFTAAASWSFTSAHPGAHLGGAVAAAGDVDGDGYGDLLVGAPGHQQRAVDDPEGGVDLFLGSAGGLGPAPAWTGEGATLAAGDLDGDGRSDLVTLGDALVAYLGACPGGDSDGDTVGDACDACAGDDRALDADRDGVCAPDDCDDADPAVYPGAADVCDGVDGRCLGETPLDELDLDCDGILPCEGDLAGVGDLLNPTWSASGGQAFARFGAAAAGGDVNGDGYADVIVGAPGHNGAQVDEGAASAWLGGPSGLTLAWSVTSGVAGMQLGASVVTLDFDGDGYDDVVLGGDALRIYRGGPAGPEATASDERPGTALLAAGDVTGDGLDDLVVGDGVSVSMFAGSPGGLGADPAWTNTIGPGGSIDHLLTADVDGDGVTDVVYSGTDDEAFCSAYGGGAGKVRVFFGGAGGLGADPDFELPALACRIGVTPAGDVDDDGHMDVWLYEYEASRVSLLIGTPAGFEYRWGDEVGEPPRPGLWSSAVGIGDVDRDGVEDLAVGGIEQVWVYLNPGDRGEPALSWAAYREQDASEFGAVVVPLGDVDGNGLADLFVGAPGFDDGLLDQGRGYVYLAFTFPATEDDDHDGIADSCDRCPGLHDVLDDTDGDGFCAPNDCDDTTPDVFPGAPERCDGLDNACTGELPDGDLDLDEDGFPACLECDDGDARSYPGAPEVCDGHDNACAGAVPADEVPVGGVLPCAGAPPRQCGCETSGAPAGLAWALAAAISRRRSRPR